MCNAIKNKEYKPHLFTKGIKSPCTQTIYDQSIYLIENEYPMKNAWTFNVSDTDIDKILLSKYREK